MRGIFISYRREDAAGDAGRLADHLRSHFGAEQVFIDVDAIAAGEDFVRTIEEAVGCCEVCLVVIGRSWLSAKDHEARRRLDDPEDYVRLEIVTALKRDIRVIPILVQRATMPRAEDLPLDLAPLAHRNAEEIRETRFRRDVDALIEALEGKRTMPAHFGSRRRAGVWVAGGVAAAVLVGALVLGHRILADRKAGPNGVGDRGGPASTSRDPTGFTLKLRVRLSEELGGISPPPELTLRHLKPNERFGVNYLPNPTPIAPGTYEYAAPLWMPSTGEEYFGQLRRVVLHARRESGPGASEKREVTEVCFERKIDELVGRDPLVRLECDEGRACRVAGDDLGWAGACRAKANQNRGGALIIPFAYAQVESPKHEPGWVAPSLKTLRELAGSEKGIGYTEFSLRTASLPSLHEADSVVYAIKVNGTPVYIDGWPPQAFRLPFDASKGLALEFGLENLDFAGAQGGVETIEVALAFRRGERVLRQENVRLSYVALRPSGPSTVKVADDLVVRWQAKYVQPRREDVFQIFLSSMTRVEAAEDLKRRLDHARLRLDKGELVGVVRPPLRTGAPYGVALGVRQPSGQVKFTFDEPTSRLLCRQTIEFSRTPDGAKVIDAGTYRRDVEKGSVRRCRDL